jgi:nucleoside-diphosphate-sugar epimerase
MKKKTTKKTLILGSSGRVGSQLLKNLCTYNNLYSYATLNHKPTSGYTKNIRNIKIDINYTGIDALKKIINKFDLIINFIGENKEKKKMYYTNYLLIKKIIDSIVPRNNKLHFIHISSCAVSSLNNLNPKSKSYIYAHSKFLGENYITTKKNSKKYNYTIIRPSQILGTGMSNKSLKLLLLLLKLRLFFYIDSKNSYWSYIFIEDVIKIINFSIFKKKLLNEIVLLSNNIRLNNLVNLIINKFNINFSPRIFSYNFINFINNFFKAILFFPILKKETIDSMISKIIYRNSKILRKINFKDCKKINYSNIDQCFYEK